MVVALTHMRVPNDRVLAAEAPEIDLILGESFFKSCLVVPSPSLAPTCAQTRTCMCPVTRR